MKIIIAGATGTIGRRITEALRKEHEIITVGSATGDVHADISDPEAVRQLFRQTGAFDALLCAAGNGHFGPLAQMKDTDFRKGINSKLMGQVNLVLEGQHYITNGGSFTLTSGIVCEEPILHATNLSAVNAAVNAFVVAAAIELKKNIRINAVCPSIVEDSKEMFPLFPGYIPVSMERVVQAYIRSLLGPLSGQVFKVY